jgi:Holliday junction resolvase-like predicted endonuclease
MKGFSGMISFRVKGEYQDCVKFVEVKFNTGLDNYGNALAKIYSTKFLCSTKVAGLGEIFIQRKFSCTWG